MSNDKTTLGQIGEPDKFEILPGLILEDKLRVRTQRRLEKHFKLPISRIFPGEAKDSESKKTVKWEGIDFTYLDNCIPLITILAQQVDDNITEDYVENVFDSVENCVRS